MNLTLFQRIDNMIYLKSTGSVNVLASKLGISPRQVKYIIRKLREDCEAPVWFDHNRQSYVYTQEGSCAFKFHSDHKEVVTKAIKDALNNCLSLLALAGCFMPDLIDQVNYLPSII